MALTKAQHTIAEIEGVRCSVVESGISAERLKFVKDILTHSGLEVKSELEKKKAETDPDKYIVGVTDITFDLIIKLYEKKLKTPQGNIVTPNIWNQVKKDEELPYWTLVSDKLRQIYISENYQFDRNY